MRNTRQETKNAIRVLDIPKIQLARMVGLEPSRISEYIRDKSLTADKTEKIENAVRQIAKVWTSLGIRTDLSDVEGFGKLLAHINHCQTENSSTKPPDSPVRLARALKRWRLVH